MLPVFDEEKCSC
ncbi:MAG: hypothetical protein DWH94_09820 [Planctomycetota bacterium]|nr:MAG: hypothetical protein DWH80_01530 [Planctomycetota bacterium]RLS55203.1 MAG: hypothetical protein DWH94_09820 [Planctomycetota bacterium]TSA01822.1 MAG: hypothetical protein D4R77_13620 [Planctomycetaceae bacterium]